MYSRMNNYTHIIHHCPNKRTNVFRKNLINYHVKILQNKRDGNHQSKNNHAIFILFKLHHIQDVKKCIKNIIR